MNAILTFIDWMQANWLELLKIWAYVIAISSIVVKVCPTIMQNKFFIFIIKIIGKLALNRNVNDDQIRAAVSAAVKK
jgi:hypothetical protein